MVLTVVGVLALTLALTAILTIVLSLIINQIRSRRFPKPRDPVFFKLDRPSEAPEPPDLYPDLPDRYLEPPERWLGPNRGWPTFKNPKRG
jgi:hypothetical protein